ncbi:MAG: cardiolipin synthase [Methylobacteriaceae bacterium]|jgi:cardiolipin synthase|nr:cardiolipin synthase [Methylobacteriaceae bacterium]
MFSAALWTIFYFISEWVIRIVMIIVVPFRRTASAARSWLLLVFFIPWPALLLYIFVGRPTYPRWRRRRFKRLPEVIAVTAGQIRGLTESAEASVSDPLVESTRFIQRLGILPLVGHSDVEMIQSYNGVIDSLVEDIDNAKSHVNLLFYIFADDETGRRVMEALVRAARRGVDCRVLLDAIGSRKWFGAVRKKLKPFGIEVRRALPVSLLRRKSARADLRNHCKIAIIDSAVGYAGSQNIINADFNHGIVNQELMTRLTGPVVLELQTLFIINWFMETDEQLPARELLSPPEKTGTVTCQVAPSGPDYEQFGVEHLLVALVHAARSRVVITTPYFVPSDSLVTALKIAVLRGVEVHLIVSEVTDHQLVKWAQCSYYHEIMENGVVLHQYRDKLLHAKHFSIDDHVSVIGSSNVDMRSFTLNSEVMVIYYDRDVTARLITIQNEYMENSDRLDPAEWDRRPLHAKFCENLARMVGFVL